MGNCQAAEAATVVLEHPGSGNKVEKIYWSVRAHEVMSSNPGHYVALVVGFTPARTENGMPVKQLKLLRPDDTLVMGQVYRLVSFREVVKEFAAKKGVKLGKLLKESGGLVADMDNSFSCPDSSSKMRLVNPSSSQKKGHEVNKVGSSSSGRSGTHRGQGRQHGSGGPWKPALHSIAEIGTLNS